MPSFLSRLLILIGVTATALGASSDRARFDHSILPVPAAGDSAHPRRGRIMRTALKSAEQSAPVHFEIALRMRNFDELQARLGRGEQIGRAEMAERYFPSAADETRLVDWARGAGLTVDRTDDNHLAIFGHGSVTAASSAFATTFARVANADGEFTSAIVAPSLPAEYAPAVLGIHGLQPHLRPHILSQRKTTTLTSAAAQTGYTPAQILTAYNAASLSLTGSGQTIAIVAEAYPADTDLTTFWAQTGATSASLSNIAHVNIEGGPASSPDSSLLIEAALDVEWASALAPGAKIRVYGSNQSSSADFDLTFQQVYADLASNPSMHVLSISFGGYELETDQDYLVIEAQYMANLASAGVTVFASSGDAGSNPDNLLQVDYPACDPNVTGVGGTSLVLDSNNNISSETAWSSSGGGSSVVYARPSWQTGIGVPSGNYRLVPDVAATADPQHGALVIEGGATKTYGGTSWATPIWAAFCAMINQSRASAGNSSLGALNPRLYPLLGTSAFRDIITPNFGASGSNGAYNATVGYDEVTGLGTPVLTALIQSNLSGIAPLAIAAQLPAAFSTLGQPATFYAVASGPGPFTYQWQREPAGTTSWSNLSDDGTYSGTTSALMVILSTAYAMNGDSYRCVVSNASASVTGKATGLTVSPVGMTTLAGWPGSAGRLDGLGWAARFDFVGAVIADSGGNIYVADGGGNTIRKVTPAGVVTTLAGKAGTAGWADGTGTNALFDGPAGLTIDSSGNVYVAEAANCTIRKVTPTGVVTTFAGTGKQPGTVNATGIAARFANPSAMASDSSGNLYVADGTGNTIRKITPAGVVTTLAGSGAAGSLDGIGTAAQFSNPQGVAVDSAGNVYVGDTSNNTIRLITPTGTVTTLAGSPSGPGTRNGVGGNARFDGPAGLRVDGSGTVYVADALNCTIRMITAAGAVSTIAGTTLDADSVDGVGTDSALNTPGDLTFGPNGIIYIADSLNFTVRRFVPGSLVAPSFTAQPSSVTVVAGAAASFTVAVSSAASAPLTYQWQIEPLGSSTWSNLTEGGSYSGTATATLSISSMSAALAGNQYRCVVSNTAASVISSAVTLNLSAAPSFATSSQMQTISVTTGSPITLTASAVGSNLSYQWTLNGVAIAGATAPTYAIGNFSSANAGVYALTATNSFGSATATIATLSVGSTRLLNISASSSISGGSLLTAGFVIGGTGTKTVLLRGIGPALATFGVSGVLADPALTFFNAGGTQLATNSGWGGTTVLSAAFTLTQAFPLAADSPDDALLMPDLATGKYTSQVNSISGGSGVALNEIYEADGATPTARLINLSALSTVFPNAPLTGGFVIGGSGMEKVLIRGIGPSLTVFGVGGVLTSPVLTVFSSSNPSTPIATNSGWSANPSTTTAQFAAVFTSVGAFAINSGSGDAAVLLTLAPGNYTAQITGANGASGQALIEIYEVTP